MILYYNPKSDDCQLIKKCTERTHPIVSFHASLYNNFSISSGISDYTETRQQKMKRGFKFQREAKEWKRAFGEDAGQPRHDVSAIV